LSGFDVDLDHARNHGNSAFDGKFAEKIHDKGWSCALSGLTRTRHQKLGVPESLPRSFELTRILMLNPDRRDVGSPAAFHLHRSMGFSR